MDLTRYGSDGSEGVPLVLVVREAGDKVKRWEVMTVRGLLAVEGQREEFGGQHCRHCDGVERASFGNLGEECMREHSYMQIA